MPTNILRNIWLYGDKDLSFIHNDILSDLIKAFINSDEIVTLDCNISTQLIEILEKDKKLISTLEYKRPKIKFKIERMFLDLCSYKEFRFVKFKYNAWNLIFLSKDCYTSLIS